MHELTKQV